MFDLLVRNALLITSNHQHDVIRGGQLGISNGKIEALLEADEAASAKREIDAGGRILMPGLINAHCHAADSLFRGLVENLALESWLEQVWIAEKAILTAETTRLGTVLGLAENLLCGVTTVIDMFWYPSEAVSAARELGMRVVTGGLFFDPPGVGDRNHDIYLAEAQTFFEEFSGAEDVFPAVMPHGSYTVSPEHLKDAKKIADLHNGLLSIHAAETRAEQADIQNRYGRSVIRHMDDLGLLDERAILAHCVHVDEEEIAILAHTGTSGRA